MAPQRKRGRPVASKNKKLTVKFPLKKRTKAASKIKTEFQCNVCSKSYSSKKELRHHQAIELEQTIYVKPLIKCKECKKVFKFTKSYTKHLEMEHSKLPDSVNCDECTVRCPNEAVLVDHINTVHLRDTFSCPHCGKEFARHSHVLRHMVQSGCDGGGVTVYRCEVCDKKFTRKDNLSAHIKKQHIFRRDCLCKQCVYRSKNFSKLIKHWHNVHAETPGQYQCDYCHKWTSSRAAMAKHLEIHGEKKYSCDVCNYSTYTVEVIRRHVLTHVKNKPHKCTICSKSYIQRNQLERHLESHNGNQCSECGLVLLTRSKLHLHMRTHRGLEKLICPYKGCPYSKKEFVNEASLNNHLKVHYEKKEAYSCEVCDKKYPSPINLKRHLETHTLDRPRRCMYCVSGRAYARGEQLLRHVRKNHPSVYRGHLLHVRQVLDVDSRDHNNDRVKKSENESILNLLDVESERILQGYGGSGVLYGGMLDSHTEIEVPVENLPDKKPYSPIMSEEELIEKLSKLVEKLIDKDMLTLFGWPEETVDMILEKVIEQCGARPADREKWTRVQRLRENTKHLFLYVIEDQNIARMLNTHTIDEIVIHILKQVTDDDVAETDL